MIQFIRKSFKRKLLVCFLAVSILPFAVGVMMMTQMFRLRVAGEYEQKNQEQAEMAAQAIDKFFHEMDEALEGLAEDGNILKALTSQDQKAVSGAYERLYGAADRLTGTVQMDIYSAEGDCRLSTGYGTGQKKMPDYWGILKVARTHPDETIIRDEKEYEGSGAMLLRAARAVLDEEGECAGFVVASMGPEEIQPIFSGICGSQDGVALLNGFWEPVYTAGTAAQGGLAWVLRQRVLTGEQILSSLDGNSLYLEELKDWGFLCVLFRPQLITEEIHESMYRLAAVMGAAALIFCLWVSARMSSSLSLPLTKLNQAMDQVKKGDLETRVAVNRQDELGQLAASFNVMTGELKDYMEQQVSQQKKLNEVSIAMMQAQLNPHFLYNTLDTMKWMAKANHIPEIAVMASRLAKILRTSISSDQFITLKQELELADSYAQIQAIRFQNRFSFSYQIPPELEGCMVPKLIVQPVVENAFIHGLADCDQGNIWVTVAQKDQDVLIQVEDDGCGISPEVMEALNCRKPKRLPGRLGLYNVDTIIRLYYGDHYGLKVSRRQEGGTKAAIKLPLNRGEKVGHDN